MPTHPAVPAPARLVVLVSGSGTNLQALLDACADPSYGARVVAVGADPAEFAEDPGRFDIPDSVVGFLNGELGDPPGGWPEPFRSKALEGRTWKKPAEELDLELKARDRVRAQSVGDEVSCLGGDAAQHNEANWAAQVRRELVENLWVAR